MNPCDYSVDVSEPGQVFCRHSRVHGPGGMVPVKLCERCVWRDQPSGDLRSSSNVTWNRRGLGTWIAKWLNGIGVTKDRWHGCMVYLRIAEPARGGCGPCDRREVKLNRIGDSCSRWLRNPSRWWRRYSGKKS